MKTENPPTACTTGLSGGVVQYMQGNSLILPKAIFITYYRIKIK